MVYHFTQTLLHILIYFLTKQYKISFFLKKFNPIFHPPSINIVKLVTTWIQAFRSPIDA